MDRPVRVRFAPSPTGALHIGGVRTALYNYLFAKKHQGTFLLRIEDTDQTRYVPGAEEYIQKSLEWLGIAPTEAPWIPGEYAPYRQSERKAMYMQYALQLVEAGFAYYAFDTPEELDLMRQRLEAAKVPNPQYNAITRLQMKNSLTLPEDEVKLKLEKGDPYVIRIKIPRKEEIRFQDLIRSWVMVHSSSLDDKVLMKSDGMPTYHLANVVDDYLMKITHVIRGEEWLPSAPLHVLLYRYLGWEDSMPQFAHLPLLLNPDGKGKLSKRKAREYGFPVFPLLWNEKDEQTGEVFALEGFKEKGYLPEALLNFLAFLGWSPGSNREFYSLEELAESFSIERVNKAGVRFDIEKAKWYNQHYLRQKDDITLGQYLKEGLAKNKPEYPELSDEKAQMIALMMKERATFPDDLWKEASFLFITPEEYDEKAFQKNNTPEAVDFLRACIEILQKEENWKAQHLKHLIHDLVEAKGQKFGKVMPLFRISLTGVPAGPDLASVKEVIGKDETLKRLEKALAKAIG